MGYGTKSQSNLVFGWAEDQGARGDMEDGWSICDAFEGRPNSAFFGVYDGHGGRLCVEYVVEHLHQNLLRFLRNAKPPQGPEQCLKEAFRITDKEMLESGIMSSGCTACTCLFREEEGKPVLYAAHVGDARGVLCRGGKALRLTHPSDHKASDRDEIQRIIKAGGNVFNDRVNGMLAITRAFGDYQLKTPALPHDVVSSEPYITRSVVDAEDVFVIVACDGLWDVMQDQEAVNLVLDGLRLLLTMCESDSREAFGEILARMLVQEALALGTQDNVTCVVVLFQC